MAEENNNNNVIEGNFTQNNGGNKDKKTYVVEYFDKVTFSLMEGKKEETRTVRIIPKGISRSPNEDICESNPISGILLGKGEGEEFEAKIPQKKTVIIKNISKSEQFKSKVKAS